MGTFPYDCMIPAHRCFLLHVFAIVSMYVEKENSDFKPGQMEPAWPLQASPSRSR